MYVLCMYCIGMHVHVHVRIHVHVHVPVYRVLSIIVYWIN